MKADEKKKLFLAAAVDNITPSFENEKYLGFFIGYKQGLTEAQILVDALKTISKYCDDKPIKNYAESVLAKWSKV